MTEVHVSQVPDDAVVFVGPQGGEYFFRDGSKIYIHHRTKIKQRKRNFTPRRGAYKRFLQNQSSVS